MNKVNEYILSSDNEELDSIVLDDELLKIESHNVELYLKTLWKKLKTNGTLSFKIISLDILCKCCVTKEVPHEVLIKLVKETNLITIDTFSKYIKNAKFLRKIVCEKYMIQYVVQKVK